MEPRATKWKPKAGNGSTMGGNMPILYEDFHTFRVSTKTMQKLPK